MKNWIPILVSMIVVLCACKSDQTAIDEAENQMNAEELYYQDYEAPVDKWGFIDTNGVKAISDRFDAARPFHDGLAVVNHQGKWGMINKNDEEIIGFKYRSLFPFQDGMARFQNFEQKYGFIDEKGVEIIPASFEAADDFHEGLAKVSINGLFRYIDKSGEPVFESMFTKAGPFKDGMAKVKPFENYGMIDKQGNEIIPTEFDEVYEPSEGIIRVRKDKLYGFYVNGQLKIPPQYELATDFHQGLAAVMLKNQWSFIDTNGKNLKVLDYDQVEYGNEGFWMVNKDRKFGMINQKGNEIIPCQYKLLYKFKEGKCAYSVNGYWGFFNSDGQALTEPIFGLVWDYNNGYARALAREGLLILDENANVEFIAPSSEMRDFEEGLAPIQYIN
ncbi:WG repeat-containing protein [Portibacter marinus]|uniref:WG repeat-containing protein n=1 Tax=Portibacter marinus TaxID=2898660 RepID=UPI001F1CF629|nr:WG repeat-containing protein [Portibacter marinus]